MAATNAQILDAIRLQGTTEYQQRIPSCTQAGISATMEALFDPMNRNLWNQFVDALVNRIGMVRIHSQEWENPLRVFKGSNLLYGSTIEEAAPKWIRAHCYDDADESLLKLDRPEFAVFYHSLNREDRYDISIVEAELRTAFDSEYGLNSFINATLQIPQNSANYDEFLIMMDLISEYAHRWGFYQHHLSAPPTDEATGKELLTALRQYAELLRFPSAKYNAGLLEDVPVFARRDELVLLISAEYSASVDVNTLSGIFQLDKADIPYRKVVVPEIPVPGAVALLTTEDFFVVHDYVYQTTSFYNPKTLATNYYLHVWQVDSVSPFVPAILFTTADATDEGTVIQVVTGLTVTADPQTVAPGGWVQLAAEQQGTVTPEGKGIELRPDAVIWEVSVDKGKLNARTYVDRLGRLHVQKGIDNGAKVTVTGTATYINPDGETPTFRGSATVTVDDSLEVEPYAAEAGQRVELPAEVGKDAE